MEQTTGEKTAAGTWMAVEVMGHRRHVGLVREESRFGATFMVIEELQRDGAFKTLSYGGSAIFGYSEVTEEQARRHVLPHGHYACDVFKPSRVLPTACEDCGFDAEKHQPVKALPQGSQDDSLADQVLDYLRDDGGEHDTRDLTKRFGDGTLDVLRVLNSDGMIERVGDRPLWRWPRTEEGDAFDVGAVVERLRGEFMGDDRVQEAIKVGIRGKHDLRLVLAMTGWPEDSSPWQRVMGEDSDDPLDDDPDPDSTPDPDLEAGGGGDLP